MPTSVKRALGPVETTTEGVADTMIDTDHAAKSCITIYRKRSANISYAVGLVTQIRVGRKNLAT